MAAGAGALNIKLGGNAVYQGQEKSRLTLGIGKEAKVEDIQHSIRLIYKTSLLLIGLVALMEFSL